MRCILNRNPFIRFALCYTRIKNAILSHHRLIEVDMIIQETQTLQVTAQDMAQ